MRIRIEVWTDDGNPVKLVQFPFFRYIVQEAESHWVPQACALVAVDELPQWFRDRVLNRQLPKSARQKSA